MNYKSYSVNFRYNVCNIYFIYSMYSKKPIAILQVNNSITVTNVVCKWHLKYK